MFLVIGLVLASAIFVVLLIYQFKYKRLIEMTRDIPSPPSLPVIGHAYHFINGTPSENLEKLRKFFDQYGSVLKVWLGPELNVILDDPKDVEVVLGSMEFIDKAGHYGHLITWLRQGLLISRGRKWHKRRKVITPAFHFKILDQFIEVFDNESRLLVENLMKTSNKDVVNLYDYFTLCTLDTICGMTL